MHPTSASNIRSHPLSWIVRARIRTLLGTLRRRFFEILILGPIIVGGAVWASRRLLGDLADPLRDATRQALAVGENPLALVGLVLALLITLFQLPATGRELFRPSALSESLDATPTPDRARLAAAVLALTARNGLPCLGLLLVLPVLGSTATLPGLPTVVLRGLVAAFLLALAQIPLAFLLTRAGWLAPSGSTQRGLTVVAGGGGAALLALLLVPGGRWFLLPWWSAAAAFEDLLRRALGETGLPTLPWTLGALLSSLALAGLAVLCFDRWWRPLRERLASHSPPAARTSAHDPAPRRWERWLPDDLLRRTLLVRDLRLVRRRFSIAVPLSTTVAMVVLTVVALILGSGVVSADWQRRAVVLGAALVALARVALVPLLLAHQLPRLWMERSSGADPQEIVAAKGLTARWLVLPWLVAATCLALAVDLPGALRWMTAGQALLVGGMMASVVALSVWEVAAQPVLGLVFSGLLGLALAGLMTFYPQAWWLWLIFYFFVAGQINARAGRRIRFTELR